MRSYIFYGWADNLIDPDGGSNGVTQDQSLSTAGEPGDVVWPADGWWTSGKLGSLLKRFLASQMAI